MLVATVDSALAALAVPLIAINYVAAAAALLLSLIGVLTSLRSAGSRAAKVAISVVALACCLLGVPIVIG